MDGGGQDCNAEAGVGNNDDSADGRIGVRKEVSACGLPPPLGVGHTGKQGLAGYPSLHEERRCKGLPPHGLAANCEEVS